MEKLIVDTQRLEGRTEHTESLKFSHANLEMIVLNMWRAS